MPGSGPRIVVWQNCFIMTFIVLSTQPVEYVMPLLQLGLRGSCQKVRLWRAKLPHFMHVSICRPWPFKALGLQDKRLRTAFRTFESCELRAFWVLQFAIGKVRQHELRDRAHGWWMAVSTWPLTRWLMFYGLCRRGAEEELRLATLGAGGVRALLFFWTRRAERI